MKTYYFTNIFIIVLSVVGTFKAHHRELRELYDLRDGIPLFRATMSEARFEQLKAALRFDDPLRRDAGDKLAPVRMVVEHYNSVMKSIYKPAESLTVDEMLVEFHGRCLSAIHSNEAREVWC